MGQARENRGKRISPGGPAERMLQLDERKDEDGERRASRVSGIGVFSVQRT